VILNVENLDLYYGDAQALDGVSLSADEAELVAIIGANGAGKSSLIRAIAGIEKPRSGRIFFRGADITGWASHRTCNLGIGQVPEGRQIFPSLSVEENLEMGALLPRARGRLAEALSEVYALLPTLRNRRRQLAGTMSGGEQQMLAIGRCLMGRPELIMFDEPSLGLAPAVVQDLFRIIRLLNERGHTVLLVEQNVAASLKLADRAYVLENGRIVMHGTGKELLNDDRVRGAYLGIDALAESRPAMAKAPFHRIAFAPPLVELRRRGEEGFDLISPVALQGYETSLGHMLRRRAAAVPDRTFLAERDASGAWRRVSYAAARAHADALAQALLDRGCGPDQPLMILSGNALDHALLTLGAFVAGVPVVPVSVAYSLISRDHAKLRHIFATVKPAVVYASSGRRFANTLAALPLSGARLIVGGQAPDDLACELFADVLTTVPGREVQSAFDRITPDSVAKILFTSGSTGPPKGVINTHRMLCCNQKMLEQVWPFLRDEPLILVDWLPWNHTFGANHNFNMVLAHGGTLYIDGGRPVPDLIAHTVRNLAEISPTIYFNVPAGYAILLPHLENDDRLARNLFAKLKLLFYAGASLPQDLWERLQALSIRVTGGRVPTVSSWGATETAPAVTGGHLSVDRAGIIGLPLPGTTLRFVRNGSKLEMRVKGPNVFPGYFGRPDLTREAFDEDGFYRIGDAGRLADPGDPSKGVVFDGRVAEDFKLTTGTWVHVGALRLAALEATAPALQDAVVVGHDREAIGLLAWPNLAGLRQICKDPSLHGDAGKLIKAPDVVDHIRRGLAAHNARNPGSASAIRRVLLLLDPPSIDADEITDKGYINQRAVIEHRREMVAKLYARAVEPEVIMLD
jgi:feruloyl-CoA synthase